MIGREPETADLPMNSGRRFGTFYSPLSIVVEKCMPLGGWRIYKVFGSVKQNSSVGPGSWFASLRWPGSTTHLFDPAGRP